VSKLGRKTGLTHGLVTAFEMDNVYFDYDIGSIRFNSQMEIEGATDEAFSQPGDSGSLVVDEESRAIGLIFGGGGNGGKNGKGLSYANPIRTALNELKVDLVIS
jgi:hypothetical protein